MSVSVFVKASVRRFWLASVISLSATVAMGAGVEWNTNLRESTKKSQDTGKPLLIYFYDDASPKAKACDASTFADPSVAQIVKSNFVPIKINASESPATARHYQAANEGDFPLVLLIGTDGKEKSRFTATDKPTEFLAQTIPHLNSSSSATTVAKAASTTMPTLSAPAAALPDLKAMASSAQQNTAELTKAVTGQTAQATQSALGQLTQTFDATKQSVGNQVDATKQVVTQQVDTAKQQFETAKQNATQQLATAKNTISEQATAVTSTVGTQAGQIVGNGTTAVGQGISQFSNNLSTGGSNLLAKVQSAVPQQAPLPPNSASPNYVAPVSSPFNAIGAAAPVAQLASAAKVEPPSYSKVGSIYDPGFTPKPTTNMIAGVSPYNAPLPAPAAQNVAVAPTLPSSSNTLPMIGAQVAAPIAANNAPFAANNVPHGSGYGNSYPPQANQQPQYGQLPTQQFTQSTAPSAPPSSPNTAAENAAKLAALYPKKEVKAISAYNTENYEKYMVEKASGSLPSNAAAAQTPILPGTPAQKNFSVPPQNNALPPAAPFGAAPGFSQPQPNLNPAQSSNSVPQNVGLDGFCPVHLREVKSWKKGDARFGANHRGRIYLFASEDAQKKFMANPDYYSPAMGGNDPVAIFSRGQYVAGKREYGMVLGDRLYLFADPASRDEMIKNQQSYISAIQLAERTAGGNIIR